MKTAAGAGVRTLALRGFVLAPALTGMRSKRFDSAPSTRSVQGGRIESRWRPTGFHQVVEDLLDLHGILDHCDHP